MIDLYYWPTPNGWKVAIMLEEVGLPYRIMPVNICRGEQFKAEYLAINPNNRMPAIVDHEPIGGGAPLTIFESGAILLYLAEKTRKLMPLDARGRYETTQWLMWQMAGFGPMLGQTHHFRKFATEKIAYAIERYTNEANRLYGVLNRRLADREYVAGESFTIADIACFPWAVLHADQGQTLDEFVHVRRWFETCAARPAVAKGRAVGRDLWHLEGPDEEARKYLFGQRAHQGG
jgi:GSH-dependent disulfide-bond oxidoreductase